MWAEVLKDYVALFVITSPVGAVPMYLAMTAQDGLAHRRRTAVYAAGTALGILGGAALVGQALFDVFGITLHAFRIAGGVLLFLYGIDMVQMRTPRMRTTQEEVAGGVAQAEVGIVPLGVPMLAGPGAIATVMALRLQGEPGWRSLVAPLAAVGLIALTVLVVMWSAQRLERWLSPVALGILSRLEGLLLAAIAAQMVVAGIHGAFPRSAG